MTGKFYITGGTLPRDASSYVVRQADRDLLDGLRKGEFCYVLNPRQMGKSSLMVRTAAQLKRDGHAVAALDLTAIGQNLSPGQWYDGLLNLLGQQLDLEDELEEYSFDHEMLGPLQRFIGGIREIALPRTVADRGANSRLIIFIDEIDSVRSLPFSSDEFFAGIRECYNRRSHEPEFNALTFCLVGVATPADLIQDTRTTPFNIGRRIELNDFTESEASILASGLGEGELGARLLRRVLYWTNGHPFITQRLCSALTTHPDAANATESTVDELCEALYLSQKAQETDDNLAFVRNRILRSETDLAALLDLYYRVYRGKKVSDDASSQIGSVLKLSGIVRVTDGRYALRNRIYQKVFDREWILENMPGAEVRRQKAAFSKGAIRTGALGAMVGITLAVLGYRSDRIAKQANESLKLAEQRKEVAESETRRADQLSKDLKRALEQTSAQRDAIFLIQQDLNESVNRTRDEASRADAEAKRAQAALAREKSARMLADRERRNAQIQAQLRQAVRYALQMSVAQQEFQMGNLARTNELLNAQSPNANDREEVRGFEWRYLWTLCHQDRQTLRAHNDWVTSVVFSKDGRVVATGGNDGLVKLWSSDRLRPLATLRQRGGPIVRLALSQDGKSLAAATLSGRVIVWAVPGFREIFNQFCHRGPAEGVGFSDDGKQMVTWGRTDRELKIWNSSFAPAPPTVLRRNDDIQAVAFSPGSDKVVIGSSSAKFGFVEVFNLKTRTSARTLYSEPLSTVAYSPDGLTIVAGLTNGAIDLFSESDLPPVLQPRTPAFGIAGEANTIAFSPKGNLVAIGSRSRRVSLFRLADGKLDFVKEFFGHTDAVSQVAISPDGRLVVSASWDKTVKFWEIGNDAPSVFQATDIGGISRAVVSPASSMVALLSGGLILWDPSTGTEVGDVAGAYHSVAISPDGKYVATGGVAGEIKIRSIRSLKDVNFEANQETLVAAMTYSPDGKTLVTSGANGQIYVWDVATKKLRTKFPVENGAVHIAFAPDGQHFVTIGAPKDESSGSDVAVWDIRTLRKEASLKSAIGVLTHAAFSGDGRLLSVAGVRGVKIWSTQDWREVGPLVGHTGAVLWSAFSPDGKTIATASADKTVKLWNMATRETLATYMDHKSRVNTVGFTSDGKMLVSSGEDKALRVLRAYSFKEIGNRDKRLSRKAQN